MSDLFAGSTAGKIKVGEVEVNRIGLGTNRLTDTPPNHEFLRFAVDSGVNFIDTAHLYTAGESEVTIGNALAPFPPGLVVATKGGMDTEPNHNSDDFLRSNLAQSLQSLKTGSITLWQLHRIDPQTPFTTTLNVLSKFQREGKVKHLGLSEASVEQIEQARQQIKIVSVQNQYSLTYRKYEDVLDYCTENGIIFIPWFPLRDVNGDPELQARLQPIASKYNVNVQQLVLAWLLKRSPMMLPIPGTLSKDHLAENIAAAHIVLSDQDYEEISSIGS